MILIFKMLDMIIREICKFIMGYDEKKFINYNPQFLWRAPHWKYLMLSQFLNAHMINQSRIVLKMWINCLGNNLHLLQ